MTEARRAGRSEYTGYLKGIRRLRHTRPADRLRVPRSTRFLKVPVALKEEAKRKLKDWIVQIDMALSQPWRSAAIATTMRLHYPSCCTALRLINESDHKMCDNLLITLVVRCGRDFP